MISFNGKVALITGGTGGIGRATAVAFAKAGAAGIVVTGRRPEEGAETVRQIESAGGRALFVRGDITKEADVADAVAKTVSTFGRLDTLFNNAGLELVAPISETTEAAYRRLFDVNVLGVLLGMKHAVPAMLKTGGGAVVNNASIAGTVAMAGISVYAATKHAVIGLTKAAALEYARTGVRVNAVGPGAIETDMLDRFAGGKDSEMAKGLAAMHPMGRIGRDFEIADAVLFLASDRAAFITGQTLFIDGGFTAQ